MSTINCRKYKRASNVNELDSKMSNVRVWFAYFIEIIAGQTEHARAQVNFIRKGRLRLSQKTIFFFSKKNRFMFNSICRGDMPTRRISRGKKKKNTINRRWFYNGATQCTRYRVAYNNHSSRSSPTFSEYVRSRTTHARLTVRRRVYRQYYNYRFLLLFHVHFGRLQFF